MSYTRGSKLPAARQHLPFGALLRYVPNVQKMGFAAQTLHNRDIRDQQDAICDRKMVRPVRTISARP